MGGRFKNGAGASKSLCTHLHPAHSLYPLDVAVSIDDEPPNDRVPDINSLGQVLITNSKERAR